MFFTYFSYIIFFVLGTIVGSFLNVLVLRYNTGVSPVKGRSFCFSCGKKLNWLELVPVLSFIVQRGRCRVCKSKISWQYPIVELISGFLFVGVFCKYGGINALFTEPLALLLSLALVSVLIAITVYDLRHKIIPDGLVIVFGVISLLNIALSGGSWGWSLLAGPILALPLFLLWLFSKGQWMGLGDPKLVSGIGWYLGLSLGLSAVILAFWAGALYGCLLMILSYFDWHGLKINRKSELPFAPFLVLGFFLVFFFHWDVLNFSFLIP